MKENIREKNTFQIKNFLIIFVIMFILLEGASLIGWIGSGRYLASEYVIFLSIFFLVVSLIVNPLIMLRLDMYRTWFKSKEK